MVAVDCGINAGGAAVDVAGCDAVCEGVAEVALRSISQLSMRWRLTSPSAAGDVVTWL